MSTPVQWLDRLATPATARITFVLSALLLAAGVGLEVLARSRPDPAVDLGVIEPGVVTTVLMVPTMVIGVLLASRRPHSPVGWIFVASGLAMGWAVFAYGYVRGRDPQRQPGGRAGRPPRTDPRPSR